MSQSAFASLLGVSVRTYQDWEQGRRNPTGAAQTLLRVAVQHPEALQDLQPAVLNEDRAMTNSMAYKGFVARIDFDERDRGQIRDFHAAVLHISVLFRC